MLSQEIVELVRERMEARRTHEEAEADLRRAEAEEKNPRLREIGLRLRALTSRILQEAMKGGEDLPRRVDAIREENKTLQKEYAAELKKMGLPEDYTLPRRRCKACKDTGYQGSAMCACFKRDVILESYRQSGMGKLLERQTFDRFDLSYYPTKLLPDQTYSARDLMEMHLNYCKEYAKNFDPATSPSLLFIGGTGLGKTHLSTAIAGEVIAKGYEVVYESAPNVAAIFEKERFLPEEEAVGTRRLFQAPLLILDDLGTENASRANTSAIYHLINHRAGVAGLPTLINTNLSAKQLEKQYDTATTSRLLGEFVTKVFLGSDIRLAKLK